MTSTPEEVKDRIAVLHGYREWYQIIVEFTARLITIEEFKLMENEAMRDYAEALYTERIKKAGESLPDLNSLLNEFPGMNNHEKVIAKIIWEKMEQAASLVIAKKDKGFNFLHELSLQQNELIQQKDKEIEELMKFKKLFDNHRDSIITTNTKTK